MKKIRLVVEKREGVGSGACGRLRKQDLIPAVVYGRSGVSNLQITVPNFRQMMQIKGDSAALIELVWEDRVMLAMIQATQRNPRRDHYEHVDFKEVAANEKLHAVLPIHCEGEPEGVKNGGGILEILNHSITVECLPENLPESVRLNVTKLGLGHSIHVRDLPLLKGVTYKAGEDTVVVSCVRGAKDDSTTEATPETTEPAKEEKKPSEA